ncbi:hypothetical protein M0R04_13405 [Candidatus Dojkabacteria bacterium]|jgi:hypothetical protein|nr:hypothetical protein [Candidatus Dojkabacteria bacterium]
MSKYRIINIGVTEEQYEWLRKKSFSERVSVGSLVRDAVDDARINKVAKKSEKKSEVVLAAEDTLEELKNEGTIKGYGPVTSESISTLTKERGELNGDNYV